MMWQWLLLFALAFLPDPSMSNVENYYCEDDNCYDLLEVTRDVTKAEIKRGFRAVALRNHPDKFLDPDEKLLAEERFKKITNAYDILRDDETRADYDYMLDHPDEFYLNYYRAWRRRNAPNVDVRIVLAVTITLISAGQYYNGWGKYNEAISYFVSTPKYRNNALEIARQEGLIPQLSGVAEKKKNRGLTKQQLKQEEDRVIRKVIEEKMDIRGVYSRPTVYDLLWVQLVMAPVWTGRYAMWWCRWVYKFWILKHEYADEEKLHIIRRNMAMSQGQFESLEQHERDEFLRLELWQADVFKVYKAAKDEQAQIKLAKSGRYKCYRRYLKNHGQGRMYFDDS